MKISSLPTLKDVETLNCERVTEYKVYYSISREDYDVFSIKYVETFVLNFDECESKEFMKGSFKMQELIEKDARVRYMKVVDGVLSLTVII